MNTNETLDLFRRFRAETADDLSAAVLTLAASLGRQEQAEPLTVAEAARRLGVSVDLIYQQCSAGRIKHQRVGRSIRIDARDLEAA